MSEREARNLVQSRTAAEQRQPRVWPDAYIQRNDSGGNPSSFFDPNPYITASLAGIAEWNQNYRFRRWRLKR
jgi:hypothetical protein